MYIINEYQTTNGITAIVTPTTREDRNQAISVFYTKCAAAAVSAVEIHTVTICTDEGLPVLPPQCFKHEIQVQENNE